MKQVQPHCSIDCNNGGPYACEKAMEQRATSKAVQVLVSKDWPREHDDGRSSMNSEVECSFERSVPLKSVVLCIGYSVRCPGLCQVPMVVHYSESLSP